MTGQATKRERPFAARRQELGWSLDYAARRLRVNPRYLRSLELSRGPLSMGLARRMAREYASTLSDLTRPAEH